MIPLDSLTIGYWILNDSLGFPYYRLINIWWFPSFLYLKIKKCRDSLTWKYINMEDLPNFHFMFLIDMKFISKLLWILLNQSLSFSGPHLRLFKISKFHSFKFSNFQDFKMAKVQKVGCTNVLNFSEFVILRFPKIIFSRMFPYTF